jgi:hypothetical protein
VANKHQKADYAGRVFGVAAVSGAMAAGLAANAEILQFRVVDATELRKIRILSVLFSAAVDGTAFTAGAATFDLVPARGWTGAGTGGGTATLTGNNGKYRVAQNQNNLGVSGEIRIATTAALGAGTKTLDAQGIAALAGGASLAGTQIIVPSDFLANALQPDGEPLIVGHQEGFVVRANVPAVGTWKWTATITWAELSQ